MAMRRRPVFPLSHQERVLVLGGFGLGTAYELVKNLEYGINNALVRGWEGGVEGIMLGGLVPATRHAFYTISDAANRRGRAYRRFTDATLRLLPVGALYGAALNGFSNYRLSNQNDLESFPVDWGIGAVAGAVATGVPWLVAEGQRRGVYGRIGTELWTGTQHTYHYLAPRIQAGAINLYHNVRHLLHI